MRTKGGVMKFWWASQSQTYAAIEQGTLWTCLLRDGTALASRTLIKQLSVGDLVFNYARGSVRAVSRVAAAWVPAPRPSGYEGKKGDPDAGWLVRVDPIVTGLSLDWHELSDLIGVGSPGPLDKDGMPQQRYLSVISPEEGERLLNRVGLDVKMQSARPIETRSSGEVWALGETDAQTIGRRRREQGRLRAYLLGGRAVADCDICGRELPERLLVAAHIVPRAQLDDEHRKDFASIAMLACSLGCDDLFEFGYVIVDGAGLVRPGRVPETPALESAVDALSSRICTAHNHRTAADFAARATLILA